MCLAFWLAGGRHHGERGRVPGATSHVPGERLAQKLGLSRGQLYADALSSYFSDRGAAALTEKLNAVYDEYDALPVS